MQRILFVTNDVIGDSAAGPGIRYLELGRVLSRKGYTVTVVGRTPLFRSPQDFEWGALGTRNLFHQLRTHETVIVRGGGPLTTVLVLLAGRRARLISDLYAFTHLEVPHLAPRTFFERYVVEVRKLFHGVKMKLHGSYIDTFWVAHERQQSFLYGLLFAKGIADAKGVDLVPFGYPAEKPAKVRQRLRGVVEGIGEDDFLLIWGGGVWDWLDPVTLVRAMARIWERNRKIKLYFLGMRAPSGYVPEKGREVIELSRTSGLLGRNVFINEGWTPYADRIDFLLEADAGVSLHPASLETFFSYRTRNLDYLYCSLPMIHTEGDVWAEIIGRHGLGLVVPPGDADKVAEAVLRLYEDRTLVAGMKQNMERVFPEFTWDTIAATSAASIERGESRCRRSLAALGASVAAHYLLFSLQCVMAFLRLFFRRSSPVSPP